MTIEVPNTLDEWNQRGTDYLPGLLGLKFHVVEPTEVREFVECRPEALVGLHPRE